MSCLIYTHHPPADVLAPAEPPSARRRHPQALDFRSPTPEGEDLAAFCIREWRSTPPTLDAVAEFLELNPLVNTFQWTDLVMLASEDLERGLSDSLPLLKVHLHTHMQRRAYELWRERAPTGLLSEFKRKFARTAVRLIVDCFVPPPEDMPGILREFGMPMTVTATPAAS
ncbi:hypothetical protein EIP86_010778, partial [Pleurotus ostreatoroseus]